MKNKMMLEVLSLACACGAALAQSTSSLMEVPYLSTRLVAGTTSLEGPAITGPESIGEIPGEESETGFGVQLEGGYPMDHGLFLRGMAEWVRYGDDPGFDMTRLSLGLGLQRSLGSWAGIGWYGYGIASVDAARSTGLGEYGNNPTYGGLGDGRDGDDIGIGAEAGLGARLGRKWGGELYGKYYDFGEGSGPGFGLRVDYTLSETWRLLGSWDGIWVEDAGYNIDLDTQRFTLGAAYRF